MCCSRILFIGELLELRIAGTANTHTYIHTHSKASRQTDRQPERQSDRKTDRKTTRQAGRQTDRKTTIQTDSIGGGQIHIRISTVTIKKIERK